MINRSSGRRHALAGMLALALAGCTVTRAQGQGPTTGSGDNSSFSEAGVEHIETERRAVVDLSMALTADDLGADGGTLRDVDVRGEDPIEVVVRGTGGELVLHAEVIRVLVAPGDRQVESIALFESHSDGDALVTRVEEVAGQVGLDRARVDSFAVAARDGRADTWLNGGDHLGFTVGLHPVLRPGEAPVLEHQLTPPD